MIYEIYYDTNRPHKSIFDIEIYLKKIDEDIPTKGLWFVELRSDAFVSGVVNFLKDKSNDESFDYEQFIEDCYDLEELRGWLWETHTNHPRTLEEAKKDKDEWEIYMRGKIVDFIKKYNLYLKTD